MPMIRSAHVRAAALALLIPGVTVLMTAICAPRAFADPYAILASVKGRVDVAAQ